MAKRKTKRAPKAKLTARRIGSPERPERRDEAEKVGKEIAKLERAIFLNDYSKLEGEQTTILRNGKLEEVVYDDKKFNEQQRDDFMNNWLFDRRQELYKELGYGEKKWREYPPSPEGASYKEIKERNDQILKERAKLEAKVIEMKYWDSDYREKAFDVYGLLDQYEVRIASHNAQLELADERNAKIEYARSLTPEQLGEHNRDKREAIAYVEMELDMLKRRLGRVETETPNKLGSIEVLKKRVIEVETNLILLEREVLPENVPQALEPYTKVITPKVWNEALNDSEINGEGAANYSERVENAGMIVAQERAARAITAQVEAKHGPEINDGDIIDMVQGPDGVWFYPYDAESEVAGAAMVRAMDVRHGGAGPGELPQLEFPPVPVAYYREKPNATAQEQEDYTDWLEGFREEGFISDDTGQVAEDAGEWLRTRQRQRRRGGEELPTPDEIPVIDYEPIPLPGDPDEEDWQLPNPEDIPVIDMTPIEMPEDSGEDEGDVVEIDFSLDDDADGPQPGEDHTFVSPDPSDTDLDGVPAVEEPLEPSEPVGATTAAEVKSTYEDHKDSNRSVWGWLKDTAYEKMKPAAPYMPWIAERVRGIMTAGITSSYKALRFRGVTQEMGRRIEELNFNTFVHAHPEDRFHDPSQDMTPPEVANFINRRLEHNDRIIADICAEVKARMEEEFGTYTRKKWLGLFGEDVEVKQYTADVVAQEIVTPEKMAAFEADLRALLLREQTTYENITSNDYAVLVRKHFDEGWWKRHFYGVVEPIVGWGAGLGLAGLVGNGIKGWFGGTAVEGAQTGVNNVINQNIEAAALPNPAAAVPEVIPEVVAAGGGGLPEAVAEGLATGKYVTTENGFREAVLAVAQDAGVQIGEKTLQEAAVGGAEGMGIGIEGILPMSPVEGLMMMDTQMPATQLTAAGVEGILKVIQAREAAGLASL